MDTQGYKALGLGNTGMFWDGSEQYWEPTIKAIDSVWNTYDTIPVNRDKYLPLDVNLIAEDGRSRYESNDPEYYTEGDKYFGTFGYENPMINGVQLKPMRVASDNSGVYRSPPALNKLERYNEMLNKGVFLNAKHAAKHRPILDDKSERRTLALSDGGVRAMKEITNENEITRPYSSVGMHELGGHYYDDAIAGEGRLTSNDCKCYYAKLWSRFITRRIYRKVDE